MRILQLAPYYRPAYAFGGVVRAVEGMATALAERGHQVTVLTTDALDQSTRFSGTSEETVDGIQVLRRPNLSPWLRGKLNLSTPRSMKKTAESILPDVDVLHLHEFRTLENLLVTPVAMELDVPIILSPHGTLALSTGRSRFKRVWDQLLGASVALRIDHVLALTQSELNDAQRLWAQFGRRTPSTSFTVIPNGIHLAEFAALPSASALRGRYGFGDAPTVLFLGRLQARKGLDVLVRAFQQVSIDNARLLIAGPDEGMLATLQALAAGDPRIVFTGYLDSAERLEALAAADIFALPATGEGLSIAALEAMAAGMPVVLSPGCNMPEVEPAGAGFVVDATVDAFADKLRLLLVDGTRRAQMGTTARQLVTERYTWERVARALETVYSNLNRMQQT